jgi:eukaryotic-like serine/threonine-protein kinase
VDATHVGSESQQKVANVRAKNFEIAMKLDVPIPESPDHTSTPLFMTKIALRQKIRHFEVIERIGEGAMGEVFKVRDLHLGRLVALKALKPGLMTPSARERFFREARVAATLNHRNIVTIFDAFTEDDVDFIAMELITGKTLAQLIAERSLSEDEALEFAQQIADALHAANRAGVVHRDLKPGNIMVTEDRVVKVLDFGLAKLAISTEFSGADATTMVSFDSDQTTPGTIVGTAAYMSPEQAEGKTVDARSDIFSFGAILYEMLTRRRAFQGETGVSTLVAILTKQPAPLAEIAPGISEPLQSIVSRCLRKDVERRFQTAADLRAALRDVRDELGEVAQMPAAESRVGSFRRPWILMAIAGIVLIATLAIILLYNGRRNPPAEILARAVPVTAFRGNEANPSFSPDGSQIAFSWDGQAGDNSDIYVKLVGPGTPVRITHDPRPDICPSWSRDGRSIAFLRQLSDNEASLNVIPALGGRERTLLNLGLSYILGASQPAWSNDSKWLIISAAIPGRSQQGLARVSVESGQLSWITEPDTASGLNDVMPALAPNGRLLAFSRVGGGFITAAFVLPVSDSLATAGQPIALDQGGISALNPEWLNDDELIVATGGVQSTLWRLSVTPKVPVQPLVVPGTDVIQPAIQPAAHRLAYVSKTQDTNIWSVELANKTQTAKNPVQVIASTQSDVNPQVAPDGEHIAFSSNRSGKYEVWISGAGATDAYQLTTMGAGTTGSPRWSPSGREIAFDSNLGGRANIYVVNSEGGTPRRLTQSAGANVVPCWSKDGKAIFFGSNRTGMFQIWKMEGDGNHPVMITKDGGFAPLLDVSGEFIYYAKSPALSSDVWKVPVSGGEERKIIDGIYRFSFALSPQGLYFVSAPQFGKAAFIRFLDFSTEKMTDVLPISDPADLGLGLSPDYRRLFFAKVDHSDSDIMLIENIR